MAKTIIMQLSRDSEDDIIDIEDEQGQVQQRMGLLKHLPDSYLHKTLDAVCEYMTNSSGDEYNSPLTEDEQQIAQDYISLLNEPDNIRFHPRIGDEYNTSVTLTMNDTLSQKLDDIVQPKEIVENGQTHTYKSIDLMVKYEPGGGIIQK